MKNAQTAPVADYLSVRLLLPLLLPLLLFAGYRSCSKNQVGSGTSGAPANVMPEKPGGGGGGIATLVLSQAPKPVRELIRHLKTVRDLRPPRGFKGGRVFRNREGTLPRGKTYYEYDVHPTVPGVSRGAERLVVDQQKQHFYYTKDHYRTFIQIK